MIGGEDEEDALVVKKGVKRDIADPFPVDIFTYMWLYNALQSNKNIIIHSNSRPHNNIITQRKAL